MTLHDAPSTRRETTQLEHLHGLVLLTTGNGFIENDFAFVINPSTRKYVKLNAPGSVSVYDYGRVHICYFFGYDEVRNEHKVLNIRMLGIKSLRPFQPSSVEIMLFELGSFEWRKIDVEIPIDISGEDWYYGTKLSVCVNSVIHLMLQSRNEVLAFDLRREIFEIIKIPHESLPIEYSSSYDCKGMRTLKFNQPFLMKANGFLGVLCHDRVVESNEMDIWMLKDYDERVWVKETIVFGESWVDLQGPFPSDCVNVDEILFAPIRVSRNLIRVPIYDVKTRSFKSVKYFLGEHFLRAKTVKFNQIRRYDESILPLERSATTTS
ncbi:putative F-box domain-containing protein [Tanacetum coccineum]|uniref:F-box domain-containing protein n=1 Tax=Tanacetum coccineum TaxID=301880 RepID=A0ABQ5HY86_9ASTR